MNKEELKKIKAGSKMTITFEEKSSEFYNSYCDILVFSKKITKDNIIIEGKVLKSDKIKKDSIIEIELDLNYYEKI